MHRIVRFLSVIFLFILAGLQPANAQSGNRQATAVIDSEKNEILTKQSEEFQAIKNDQLSDSIRLLQLKKEILELGNANQSKKQALAVERDLITVKDSVRKTRQKQKVDSLRAIAVGFPIVISRDTLFFVFSKLGSYSPKARAKVITERIYKLAENYYFKADSLIVVPSELTTDVTYGDQTIISISDLDAIWLNGSRETIAQEYRNIIANEIRLYKSEHSWQNILKEVLLALLVMAMLILIIYTVNRLFRGIKTKIEKQKDARLRGIKIRNYEFLDSGRQVTAVLSVVRIIKWILILILIYFSLPVLFGIFPWTEGFAGKLINYFIDPITHILVSIWNYLPNLFTVVVLVIFFRYLLQVLRYFKTEIEKGVLKIPGFYIDWANPTYQIVRVLVLAFMLIVVFPYLPGSDSQVFKGVSVFLGVLFTFGSAGALSNIVAGLVLTYMRAYKLGDRVKIGDVTGDVVEKSLLVTRIITIKNEIVSIPNSSVMGSHTTNFTAEAAEHGLILHTTVTIGYDAPWRQVHDLLIQSALATDLIEKDPAPFVFQTSLDDFYVSYQINAYTKASNRQHVTYSLLHQQIQDHFNAAGVEIMSSHYGNIRDGNKTTIPDENLPKDYVTPSFRVKKD